MAKSINTYKKEYKLFGITILSETESYYEVSAENGTELIDDEIILRERINELKKKEKWWWFK